MSQFECANTDKSQKTKERMHKYIQEEEAKLKFNKPKAIAIPTSHKVGFYLGSWVDTLAGRQEVEIAVKFEPISF